jgi:hypothetical protein
MSDDERAAAPGPDDPHDAEPAQPAAEPGLDEAAVLEAAFDEAAFVGKLLLVGLVRVSAGGQVVAQTQLHGRIAEVSGEGIVIDTADGRRMTLPPDPAALQPAPPGEYRERSSGATIVNPDFVALWEIREARDPGAPPAWVARPVAFPGAPRGGETR